MTVGNLGWKPSGNPFVRHWNCSQWKQQAVPSIGREFNRLAGGFPSDVSVAFRCGPETVTVRIPTEELDVSEIDPAKMLTDSPDGIAYLFRWARAHYAVLNEAHERIARKYGVSTDGVMISRPIPTTRVKERS